MTVQKLIRFLNFKLLVLFIIAVLLFILVLYFSFGEVYAAGPENGNIQPKVEMTVKDNQNTLSIKDSVIKIPDAVARGLTNFGTGAAVAAGMKAGGSIAKTAGGSPFAKLGMITYWVFIINYR